jgi:uncharacterized protein YbaP (TraB family)
MIYGRNQIMAERIKAMMLEKTACIAIGAGHLGGRKGVLKLLQREGVAVRQLS